MTPYRHISSSGDLRPGIPPFMFADLTYDEQFLADPGGGLFDGYNFRANGMFDPRVETGGHQPRFFDQLMAMYTYFCVTHADVFVEGAPYQNLLVAGTSADPAYQGLVIIAPHGAAASPSAATADMLEFPGVQSAPLSQGTASRVALRIDIARELGIKPASVLNNPAFWGTASADPTIQSLVSVGACALGAGNPGQMQVQARITYRCKFFCPLVPGSS